jgi:hypothetical protein
MLVCAFFTFSNSERACLSELQRVSNKRAVCGVVWCVCVCVCVCV